MIIKYRSHTFTVPDSDLIVMGDSFYAKVDLGQRGQSFPHYIKVTPPVAEVKSPFDSGMVYCYPAIPQNFDSGLLYTVEPDPRTMDNVLALTEILNTRNPERQASRDLYTYQLYCEIADTIAA